MGSGMGLVACPALEPAQGRAAKIIATLSKVLVRHAKRAPAFVPEPFVNLVLILYSGRFKTNARPCFRGRDLFPAADKHGHVHTDAGDILGREDRIGIGGDGGNTGFFHCGDKKLCIHSKSHTWGQLAALGAGGPQHPDHGPGLIDNRAPGVTGQGGDGQPFNTGFTG